MKQLFILLCAILFTASCTSSEDKVRDLVLKHVELSVDNPDQLQIIGFVPVDSAFGINYLSPKECKFLYESSKKVSEAIMKKTKGFTDFSNSNTAMMGLIERQMKAANEIRSILLTSPKKGEFSGYKARVHYQCTDASGNQYKAIRWYFTEPEGKQVLRFFEVPVL